MVKRKITRTLFFRPRFLIGVSIFAVGTFGSVAMNELWMMIASFIVALPIVMVEGYRYFSSFDGHDWRR